MASNERCTVCGRTDHPLVASVKDDSIEDSDVPMCAACHSDTLKMIYVDGVRRSDWETAKSDLFKLVNWLHGVGFNLGRGGGDRKRALAEADRWRARPPAGRFKCVLCGEKVSVGIGTWDDGQIRNFHCSRCVHIQVGRTWFIRAGTEVLMRVGRRRGDDSPEFRERLNLVIAEWLLRDGLQLIKAAAKSKLDGEVPPPPPSQDQSMLWEPEDRQDEAPSPRRRRYSRIQRSD